MVKKANVSPSHPRRAKTRLSHGVGRSERGGDAYSVRYGEPPSDARTKLADFFNILLEANLFQGPEGQIHAERRLQEIERRP